MRKLLEPIAISTSVRCKWLIYCIVSLMYVIYTSLASLANQPFSLTHKRNRYRLLVSLCALLWLTSCSSYHTEDYAEKTPTLDIRQYLNGSVKAHGIIFDWKGKASRHFTADIVGNWKGNVGTLEEQFIFSDGQKQQRTWTIRFTDDHFFTATAGDVIGTAEGSQHGNAAHMEYLLNHQDQDGTTIHITVDDWLFLGEDGVLLNRSKLYKYGIPVGEIFISFSKAQPVTKEAVQ